MREELLEKAQYKNLEEREELKNYFRFQYMPPYSQLF